ncbi:MAG TPA: sigma-70 family RNA polymerase sigma factor, partial [Terriglobia bacterium]|nr:sigma-70 family RNA polymerase sigma factor [Terriglobia bacterium]
LQFWKRAQITGVDPDALCDWLPGHDVSPEASAMAREQMDAVWRVTAELSERQRTVFLLRFVEDMELLEIAKATGLKEGAVKVHLFRAVHKVREQIGEMR